MSYFTIDCDFFRDMKTLRLQAAYGANGCWCLIRLWSHAAEFLDDGSRRYTAEDIEIVADWRGKKGKLTNALCQVGYLDQVEEDQYILHDWAGRVVATAAGDENA